MNDNIGLIIGGVFVVIVLAWILTTQQNGQNSFAMAAGSTGKVATAGIGALMPH